MECCPRSHLGTPGGVVWDLYTGRLRWPFRTDVSVLYDVERELTGSGLKGLNTKAVPEEAEKLVLWLRQKAANIARGDGESARVMRTAADRIAAGS